MNIQRLKFAWARGARLQAFYKDDPYWWDMHIPVFSKDAKAFRTHPDDAHLEYGTLSSALRNTVINGVTAVAFLPATGAVASLFPELQNEWWDLSGDARLMQFLFIAELLADEGL